MGFFSPVYCLDMDNIPIKSKKDGKIKFEPLGNNLGSMFIIHKFTCKALKLSTLDLLLYLRHL